MATMPGSIDLNSPAKYPIVLSDALSGRGTKELLTSVHYNHKPTPSAGGSLSSQQLKPSTSSDSEKFDLSFNDGPEHYEYSGTRNAADGQYVLIFDPVKKHFVLHQIDSSFDMNLISTPEDQDAESLRSSYPQLEQRSRLRRKSSSVNKSQPKGISQDEAADSKRRKTEKPKKTKPPPREPTPDAEDEDSDGDLKIEYPDGPPPRPFQPYTAAIPLREETSEESEESDAEYEDDDDERNQDVDVLQLGSPARQVGVGEGGGGGYVDDDEMDFDLEAELEQALANENENDESSESEEE